MKKIAFLLVILSANLSLISCDHTSTAAEDAAYANINATEGDDGVIIKDPDAEEEDDNN
ncbi:hypothetical protein Celal_0841 [Cellulophaga algicola DSM 14237]|uniref:Secreted protein n=1 Tax=Cellulophaga algicola (strain DSM 14237 / IC166 / ACAM 630) TaxID=688270 RepID=E6XEW8_CELAD|nr:MULTISPECIES: hypothetical protein [Cellulophaga]ADV48170.1 hypothetical protein Celal_0841 [Cellulophaga algicola DSM 14237]